MRYKPGLRYSNKRTTIERLRKILVREVKTNKNASTVTNPRSDVNEIQDSQPAGSKIDKSIGVRASSNENSDTENDDYSLRVSKMKYLKHPAKPLFQNDSDVDVTILSNEESDEEDHHTYKCN